MADANMFSLSGGQTNPPPSLPSMSGLSHEMNIPGPANIDPSPMLERFANIRNLQNQNALFQQTYAARVRSGQILAGAPDTETGITRLMHDPVTAPFAGETINTLRQAQLALIEMQGKSAEQSASGLKAFYGMMPALIADPSQFDTIASNALATMSPIARAQVAPAIDSLKKSLLSGLPTDNPQQARAILTQRLVGYSMAAGLPPDSLSPLIGKPATANTGGMTQFGVQLPAQFGGGFAPANSLPMTPPPERKTLPVGPSGTPQTFSITGNEATPVTIAPAGNSMAPASAPASGPVAGAPVQPPGSVPPDHAAINDTLHNGDQPGTFAGDQGHNLLTGPSQIDVAANEAGGKVVGEITSDMVADAKTIPSTVKRFDVMTDALKHFESGGLAETRGGLAKFLQGLRDVGFTGITQEDIDKVGNASLADTQVFNANVKPLMIEELKAAAQGTGRVMRTEVDQFLARINSETDPRAIVRLLNNDRYLIQVGYARTKAWPQFRDESQAGQIPGYKPQDFYTWFNEKQNMLKLPTKTGGGLNIDPTTPAVAPTSFKSADDVKAAYHAHKISREDAKAALAKFGYK